MLSSSEVDVNLTLGSVALELIQKIETSQENVRVSREMEDLVSSVKSEIDESAIDVDTKNSLKGAVGSWGAANASERFRQLMIDYGVVDEGISGLPLQRMKFVSSMRNGIVHNGEIRKPVWIEDEEIQCQISYHYCSRLIPYLVVEYINRRLGLMGFNWPKQTVDLIRNYINTGLWYGEKIEEILE